MEPDNNESVPTQSEVPDVPIKIETPTAPKPKSYPSKDDEVIDLMEDDENDDDIMPDVTTPDISTNINDAEVTREASTGIMPVENGENANDSLVEDEPTDEQIEAATFALAARVKGRKKQPAKKDPAEIKYLEAKKIYDKKKKANKLSIEDEIQFMLLDSKETARKRKEAADAEYERTPTPESDDDADSGLFVSNVPRFSDDHSEDDASSRSKRKRFSDSDDGMPAAKKRGRPKGRTAKKATKVAGHNYTDGDFDDIIETARNEKAAKSKSKARPKGKANGPKKTALPKAKGRGPKAQGTNMTNTDTLLASDIFLETAKASNLASQPTFSSTLTRRNDALKQLIASVPQEDAGVAKHDKKYLDEAIKDFTGHGSVLTGHNGNWIVKGMRSELKSYQILGTAFMRRRENDQNLPRGGILADQMGLGKTVMMLANIVNGKPKDRNSLKTTLIVASPALVSQWQEEIRQHTESSRDNKHGLGRIMQYRSGSRINSNDDTGILHSADIILTTYGEVSKSYPKADIPADKVTAKQKDDWWRNYFEQHKGVLHQMKFLRVVLDEAQAIKNHKSHTSMACRALNAKHYWAITGTPILNSIKEFYPYFKFLREPNTGSFKIFKENFCTRDDPEGKERLNVFLRKFMIRRTHLDRLFNARLLDLPRPSERTIWLEFHEVERQVYEIVRKRFIARINHMAKQGDVERKYNHIYSMMTHLRQLCAHLLLVQGPICDLLEREDFEKLNKITESEDDLTEEGEALLIHLRNVLKSNIGLKSVEGGIGASVITENETLATGVIDVDGNQGDAGGKHGIHFRFRKYLDNLRKTDSWEAIVERTSCCGCRQPPEDPQITSCFHIFCHKCLRDLQHLAARRGHDHATCSECGEAYTSTYPCPGLEDWPERETNSTSTDHQSVKNAGKGKKDDNDWISMKGEVLPSAKTRATKAALMNIFEEDPKTKTIIYTQWRPLIRVLSKVCNSEQWEHVQYHGGMSHESREKAIHEFSTSPTKNIMIASLKAGGLGLNLTCASRVLLIDPWWNTAVEQQAFCRVFRIGQQKETSMTRFVIKNTIDAMLMAIKERKQLEIDEVMDAAKMKEKLSVQDLMGLFGDVGEDGEGKPFIFAEQTTGEEHHRFANVDSDDEEGYMGNEE